MAEKNKELEKVNQRIEQLFDQWQALQPMKAEDQERFDKKVCLDWNFHSNKIEGNTLTYGETELLLIFGRYEGGHLERNYLEMQAHDVAINKVREFAKDKDRNLTEADIRNLNKIILKEPFWSQAQAPDGTPTKKQIMPGEYKKQPNHVRTATREIFKFSEPHEVPLKMNELMKWFHKEIESPSLSIASFLAQLHHRFILIHPFDDGNGRIVRLLINYVLLRLGYPPLVIKSSDRENYLIAINKADTGDVETLAIYLGKVLMFWLELGIKAAKGEDISDPSDVDKEVDLFVREQESKGLHKSSDVHLSKQNVVHLYDKSLIFLFEIFENKLKVFNQLFHSTIIDKHIHVTHLNGKHYSYSNTDNHLKRLLLDKKIVWQEISNIRTSVAIFYKAYQGQYNKYVEKSFDVKIFLSIEMHESKYNIRMNLLRYFGDSEHTCTKSLKKERFYNQLLTQKEADKFVAQGKKEFLKLLKQAIGKYSNDKK